MVILFSHRETGGGKHPVVMRVWETPVPIPNTMVKPYAAEDTMLATAWESRWLPDGKAGGCRMIFLIITHLLSDKRAEVRNIRTRVFSFERSISFPLSDD